MSLVRLVSCSPTFRVSEVHRKGVNGVHLCTRVVQLIHRCSSHLSDLTPAVHFFFCGNRYSSPRKIVLLHDFSAACVRCCNLITFFPKLRLRVGFILVSRELSLDSRISRRPGCRSRPWIPGFLVALAARVWKLFLDSRISRRRRRRVPKPRCLSYIMLSML